KKYQPIKANIERQLGLLLDLVERGDVLLIAFSGHGVHLGKTSYLCPTEARLEEPKSLVSLDVVYERLKESPAALKLVMVDACRNDPRQPGQKSVARGSGRIADALAREKPPEGVLLLSSCAPGEISWEEAEFHNGVFMHFVIGGLQGPADADQNGKITLHEMSKYAADKTNAYVLRKFNSTQRPFLRGDSTLAAMNYDLFRLSNDSGSKEDIFRQTRQDRPYSTRSGSAEGKRASGATVASEAAVARALKWLAEHQNADGSWSFDHTGGKCKGQCSYAGKLKDARFAATGLALLPFLGAGQTHKQGNYKDTVRGGLYWLAANMRVTPNGGDMTAGGGSMYGHGIATIALCEGYAMTHDEQLAAFAQAALNFIIDAQDPVGGGWSHTPRGAGDTSNAGWQIVALTSGYLGNLHVAKPTLAAAMKFLDSVQTDGGALYRYRSPASTGTGTSTGTGMGSGTASETTAIGLLCRMYMGWQHDKPELQRGVNYLTTVGPQVGNMCFGYYA
ncbi:MAG: caspase family protein, partial [Terriglobales bacterium]